MHGVKRAVHIVINVILWILIVIIAFFAIVTFSRKGNGETMSIFGYTPMTVLSDSMAPTFHQDDLILVHHGDPSAYEAGDVISFWTVIDGQRVINTHRIQSVYAEGGMVQFVTKGDANPDADPYIVSTPDVIGKYVLSIPFLGKILSVLSTSTGFLVIIVIPILAFFLYQLYRLIVLLIELKRQTVIEATRAAMEQLEREKQQQAGDAPQPEQPAAVSTGGEEGKTP